MCLLFLFNKTHKKASIEADSARILALIMKAIDGIRTRGLHLGKVALYQLSYYRILFTGFLPREQVILYYAELSVSMTNLFFGKLDEFALQTSLSRSTFIKFTLFCMSDQIHLSLSRIRLSCRPPGLQAYLPLRQAYMRHYPIL